jgi:histone H3/H4
LADYSHGGPKVAQDVFEIEAALGAKRGSLANAIRQVTAEQGMAVETVKKHAQRYAEHFREDAHARRQRLARFAGLERRISGFPDDVRAKFLAAPASRAMRLLVNQRIDGTCPAWLVDCVRSHQGDGRSLMSRLEEAAPVG